MAITTATSMAAAASSNVAGRRLVIAVVTGSLVRSEVPRLPWATPLRNERY
jgi:hypothetical protein